MPNGVTVSAAEATENLSFMLDVCGDLFQLLEGEVKYCPGYFTRLSVFVLFILMSYFLFRCIYLSIFTL